MSTKGSLVKLTSSGLGVIRPNHPAWTARSRSLEAQGIHGVEARGFSREEQTR
jgi:hypothetical protein